ncbi:unnamed protein product [Vitrella brassicaformis CCMP3155]|uniref:Uncharacterized protein n=1 Tax=Vitrella brassicaformis (strain CCMP3155) TaxID=1169540 RepID=A0A0G4GE12_VITBC|nr:unnamed protein product [Vitrella brassicaformis CCMP3155]|eukprot:CEM27223.1 unnamed protein product [Vitrella brassicaformis CCMP3155]
MSATSSQPPEERPASQMEEERQEGDGEERCHGSFTLVRVEGKDGDTPISRQLADRILTRSLTCAAADEVGALVDGGADADAAAVVRGVNHRASFACTIPLLAWAVDNPTNSDFSPEGVQVVHSCLSNWPSREIQAAVLEALIAGGAAVTSQGKEALGAALYFANVTALEVLLRHGVGVRLGDTGFNGPLLCPRPTTLPARPSPQYQNHMLAIFDTLLQHEPALATEEAPGSKKTPIQWAPWPFGEMSREFCRRYLDLLSAHGASLIDPNKSGNTPLTYAVWHGAVHMVEWLCERLPVAHITSAPVVDTLSPLDLAAIPPLSRPDRPEDEGCTDSERRKEVVRVLLRHLGSTQQQESAIRQMNTKDLRVRSGARFIRIVQREMQTSPQQPQQQQQQRQPSEKAERAAAKLAERLIAEEAREREKERRASKKGGGKCKAGNHKQRQQSVDLSSDGRDGEADGLGEGDGEREPSVSSTAPDTRMSTGAVSTSDAEERPTSSIDPFLGPSGPSVSSSSSASPPADPLGHGDGDDSDGGSEFIPVHRKHKKKHKTHAQQPTIPPQSPLGRDGRPLPSSCGGHPGPQGLSARGLVDSHIHRGAPPLVPTAAMPPVQVSSPSSNLPLSSAVDPRPARPTGPGVPAASSMSGTSTSSNSSSSSGNLPLPPPPSFPPPPPPTRPAAPAIGRLGMAHSCASARLVNDLRRQLEQKERDARDAKEKEEGLMRQLQQTKWKLAQLQHQQHQQPSPSSSSSAAPSVSPPSATADCTICFGEHGPASVMYIPCRHMHICTKCYADRRAAWQLSLPRIRAANARRAEENKERIKEAREPLPMRPEEYLCEQCKTEVVFAGSVDEVARWAATPFVGQPG